MAKLQERRVRLGLLLAEIGRINNIDVTAEELRQAILQEVRKYPGQERQVMEYFNKTSKRSAGLRFSRTRSSISCLELAEAERSVTPEELMADPDAPAE